MRDGGVDIDLYIDVIFAVNFFMDFLLLLFLKKVLKKTASWKRLAAGAAAGGLFGCLEAMTLQLPGWVMMTASAGAAAVMTAIVYRPEGLRELVKTTVSLYVLAVLTGGLMELLYGYTRAGFFLARILLGHGGDVLPLVSWLFTAAGACFLAWGLRQFAGEMVRERKNHYLVVLKDGDVKVKATGYLDTGNCLTEPGTGQGVSIVTEKIWNLFKGAHEERTMIPYHTVGNPYGVMEGFRIEQLEIRGLSAGKREDNIKVRNPWIAKAPFGFARGGGFDVLLHREAAAAGQDEEGGITNGD